MTGSRLLSAPWLLPITGPLLGDGAVLLDDSDAIRAVGTRHHLRREHPSVEEERADGVLMPALVNAHTHLELSALQGLAPGGGGFVDWAVRSVAAQATIAAPVRARAIEDAVAALVATGTAAVGDVGNTIAAVPALARAGVQGLFFHELLGSREARTGGALADAERERATLPEWPAALAAVPAPHAPYSVGPDLLRRIFAEARRLGRPTSVHVAEDEDELRLLRDGTGAWPPILDRMGVRAGERTPGSSPVAYLADLGALDTTRPPLLVHMVHADPDDRRLAARAGATVVLCPRSNLHVGGRLPDARALLADGVALAIGTDSLASNTDLSPWGELAALSAHAPEVGPLVWLRAATLGGAAALGLAALGALEPGRRPGILEVACEDPARPLAGLVRSPAPRVTWRARP